MTEYIEIPLKVFGYGFVISLGIAGLIKILMFFITQMAKNEKK